MENLRSIRTSTAMRLVVLFSLFFFLILIAGGIGSALGMVPGLPLRVVYLLSSIVQSLFAFCIPAWLTALFSENNPWSFLGISEKVNFRPFLGVLIVYCLALPCMNQIIFWNENLHFPSWCAGIESTLRELEEANGKIAETMLEMKNIWQVLATIGVVGLLTGFSEEIFFRGTMQRIFSQSGIRNWIAVWGTALIFSAMHFQFFGFVPRTLMGVFFGYLFIWSGSLWPAVFAHSLNNTMVVLGVWWSEDRLNSNIDNLGIISDASIPWVAIASGIATILFLVKFRNYFFKINI